MTNDHYRCIGKDAGGGEIWAVDEGWMWCPDCDGEGVIWHMNADPDLSEHSYPCDRCVEGKGLVPV